MKRTTVLCILAACALAFAAADGVATGSATLVVDRDGVQCANADFTSIQAAVDAAQPGDLIRVCPDLYAENVVVDKPLTLKADPEAVQAIDCFQPTLGELPTDQQAIVDPAGVSIAFKLEADDVELAGFVVQGASVAIDASDSFSGYRLHHNLVRTTTVAAYFRSSGTSPSRFDHNCLRENGRGVANHWLPLSNARIHHNSTFRNAGEAFEQTPNCPEFLETGVCSAPSVGMDHVVFDHNVSIGDAAGNSRVYRFAYSTFTTAFANTVIPAGRRVMQLFGANHDLHIIDNDLQVRQAGLARQSTPAAPPNVRVLIQGNTITGAPENDPSVATAGIGMGTDGLKNSWVMDNVISGIKGEGIALLAGNTGNVVRDNSVTNSDRDGILVAAGATGNTFEANEILGNGRIAGYVDARDDAREFNVWRGNVCLTDFPSGTICGVG